MTKRSKIARWVNHDTARRLAADPKERARRELLGDRDVARQKMLDELRATDRDLFLSLVSDTPEHRRELDRLIRGKSRDG